MVGAYQSWVSEGISSDLYNYDLVPQTPAAPGDGVPLVHCCSIEQVKCEAFEILEAETGFQQVSQGRNERQQASTAYVLW